MAYMRTRSKLEQAKQEGIIDNILEGINEDLEQCKLIFLCTPVEYNAAYLAQIQPYLKPGTIITDVGSTKTDIHEHVIRLDMEEVFVGGHPMAGSEKTGYEHSSDHLLENAYYIITPTAKSRQENIDRLVQVAEAIGSIPIVLDYKRHDQITAAISHLPHVVASSLVNLVKDNDSQDGLMKRLAAGGFKDITRIASSSPEMWEQICMTNRENISSVLNNYIASLEKIRYQLDHAQTDAIRRLFETSRDYRNSLPSKGSGPIQRIFEIYCDMVDETGGIATLATILASNQINLKNIGIVHSREFIEAVLRIEFYDEPSMKKAADILRKYRYIIYER